MHQMDLEPHRWTRTEILRVKNWLMENRSIDYMSSMLGVAHSEIVFVARSIGSLTLEQLEKPALGSDIVVSFRG